ncbi:MAG: hypothetical protein DWQ44_06685 [Bacteroidetes bacterium]|nr:MAG: hypothetical protein DWQ33_03160 [Bacteroidota bacterium]REK00983.1 MAG: hypothetical protein DWQ39_10450 [Bacteroidota bacterium]REK34586.1 MAG: hypothetical protein DWQ44_06685 [Bacteroidota bacterium]REK51845.1 MAG: hypothetical protein DWQ48_00285 [Bacteroidota bacterium]
MLIKEKNPGIYQVTISAYELAALISSARWICSGSEGPMDDSSKQQISRVLESYDLSMKQMKEHQASDVNLHK